MPVISCRVVAAELNSFIHVIWVEPAFVGVAAGPALAAPPEVDPADCFVAKPPGGRVTNLAGWQPEVRPQGVGAWVVTFEATSAADLTWLAPSALVEFNFGLPEIPRPEARVVITDPDGWSELQREIGTQGGRILHALGKPDLETFATDARDGAKDVATSLQDLIGFPLITGGANGSGPSGGGGPSGGKAFVESEIRRVLGRVPSTEDVTGTLALLDRVMELRTEDGVQRWEVRPGGAYVSQADTGAGVTGRQASVAGLARDTLEQIKPLVTKVEAIITHRENPHLLETARGNFLSSATEAVAEAGVAGGPLRMKAEVLLDQGLDELAIFGEQLGVLRFNPARNRYEPTRRNVITPPDEEQYTTFLIILDRWRVFDEFFREYLGFKPKARTKFNMGQARRKDFGLRFTLLDRRVDVIAEAVDELDAALLSVGIDRAEREAINLAHGHDGTVADLMDWAKGFAANEARPLIQNAGIRGAHLLPARLGKLHDAVDALDNEIKKNGLPGGRALRHPRVTVALDKLNRELAVAQTQAAEAANV